MTKNEAAYIVRGYINEAIREGFVPKSFGQYTQIKVNEALDVLRVDELAAAANSDVAETTGQTSK